MFFFLHPRRHPLQSSSASKLAYNRSLQTHISLANKQINLTSLSLAPISNTNQSEQLPACLHRAAATAAATAALELNYSLASNSSRVARRKAKWQLYVLDRAHRQTETNRLNECLSDCLSVFATAAAAGALCTRRSESIVSKLEPSWSTEKNSWCLSVWPASASASASASKEAGAVTCQEASEDRSTCVQQQQDSLSLCPSGILICSLVC